LVVFLNSHWVHLFKYYKNRKLPIPVFFKRERERFKATTGFGYFKNLKGPMGFMKELVVI
jgi:hypothetical protein